MKLLLTVEERLQVQYILPVQGNIKTLELAENILKKVQIKEADSGEKEFEFDDHETEFMRLMISVLDGANKLHLSSLSLVRKILTN